MIIQHWTIRINIRKYKLNIGTWKLENENIKIDKKFNPKIVKLVLEKFKLNNGDMVEIDTFKRVVKEMI